MRWFVVGLFLFAAAEGLAAKPKTQSVEPVAAPVVQTVEVDYAGKALSVLKAGNVAEAEKMLPEIKRPAARLYVQACVERAKGDARAAIQTISQAIARHYDDPDWIAESEVLSAELYIELGMLKQADVTARQIQVLYEGKDVVKKADELRIKIKSAAK